jgi:hypothetical protein
MPEDAPLMIIAPAVCEMNLLRNKPETTQVTRTTATANPSVCKLVTPNGVKVFRLFILNSSGVA